MGRGELVTGGRVEREDTSIRERSNYTQSEKLGGPVTALGRPDGPSLGVLGALASADQRSLAAGLAVNVGTWEKSWGSGAQQEG